MYFPHNNKSKCNINLNSNEADKHKPRAQQPNNKLENKTKKLSTPYDLGE